ncbi:MAG: DUF2271 domain-containing protein [Myxococcales bacterium]|nr:DUF2271 domain-containing protein [Myxococcales bacterium]
MMVLLLAGLGACSEDSAAGMPRALDPAATGAGQDSSQQAAATGSEALPQTAANPAQPTDTMTSGAAGAAADPMDTATDPAQTSTDPAMQPGDNSSDNTGNTATAGSLSIQFTTIGYGGEYAPKNYGAVWIEAQDGTFIKTVKRWAGDLHAGDLVTWTAASGGWGFALFGGGSSPDMVDAISSATLQAHQEHMVSWNMKDANQAVVPDGNYTLVLEITESRARDLAGPVMRIDFTKGTEPQTLEPADEANFTGVLVQYQP